MEFKKKYDPSTKVQLITGSESEVQQQYKEECDINNILKRYEQTGILPEMREQVQAIYGDFSNVADYQDALNLVNNAMLAFNSLDAHTRDRFSNDPMKFVAFCEDEKNYEEAVKLGLAKRKEVTIEPKQEEGVNTPS